MALEVTWLNYPPERLLKERFHINTGFHPGQRDIIEQLVGSKSSKRLLVIQRTGWGKSLCLISPPASSPDGQPLLSSPPHRLLAFEGIDARSMPTLQ
jgi:superfamily II DNA helicase RecQ